MTVSLAVVPNDIPFLEWDDFQTIFQWNQNEHVSLVGPTDSGKTTLALELLNRRKYVTVLGTKPRDETLDRFAATHGYKKLKEWNHRLDPVKYPRRIVWPNAKSLYATEHQKHVFRQTMASIYEQGSWCLYIDEIALFCHKDFGFTPEIRTFLTQARSSDIAFVGGTQRPRWVPLEFYDQPKHLFFWRENDEDNLSRISGISYLNSGMIRGLVANLPLHEALYINTRDNTMYRTMAPWKPVKEVTT